MDLKQKIQEDVKSAMRAQDELKIGTLRMLLSQLAEKQRSKRGNVFKEHPDATEEQMQEYTLLSDEEVQEVVSSEFKKRKEAIVEYDKGGRPELAEKERAEAAILQGYLPEQLSDEEVRRLVQEAIAETDAKTPQDVGRVMAALMPKVKGKADGARVNQTVKELLS